MISIGHLAVLPVVDSSFSALALELQTELDGSMGLAASMDLSGVLGGGTYIVVCCSGVVGGVVCADVSGVMDLSCAF